MPPRSERVAPVNSSNVQTVLSTYSNFLVASKKFYSPTPVYLTTNEWESDVMAAIFDPANLASPLAYDASKTALLLLDFQGFIVERCPGGKAALAKAKIMKEWALSHKVMVVHSVVNVHGKPPPTCKGAERIFKMIESISGDREAAEEPPAIAFRKADGEFSVLKQPGFISAVKSDGAMEKLHEHGIKSLILCGLSTSGAVLRTAMPATDEGFVVSVIQDGAADPVEGLHDTLMRTVLPSRANVATAEQFIEQWAKAFPEQ